MSTGTAPAVVRRLVRADALRTRRDPLLLVLVILPVLLTAAYAVALPRLHLLLTPEWARLAHIIVIAGLLVITPIMFGFVTGLMLLDERDDGVLTAIATTPVGRTGFVAYRTAVPVLWSVLVAAGVLAAVGNGIAAPATAVCLALLSGLQAPLNTLFLGAFAANKMEGMAVSKIGNLIATLGALAVLLPAPWLWLAAPSPHFWLVHILLQPRLHPLEALAAVAVHVGAIGVLAWAFQRRVG